MLDNKNVSHLISRTVSVALSPRIISSRVISEGTGIPPTTMETVVFLIYGNLVGPSLLRPGPSSCPYSPECVEGAFSEARGRGVLRNSIVRSSFGDLPAPQMLVALIQAMVLSTLDPNGERTP